MFVPRCKARSLISIFVIKIKKKLTLKRLNQARTDYGSKFLTSAETCYYCYRES